MRYSIWKTAQKGAADAVKTAAASEAILMGLTDVDGLEAHVAAITTGLVTGLIRGIANWLKNRKKT